MQVGRSLRIVSACLLAFVAGSGQRVAGPGTSGSSLTQSLAELFRDHHVATQIDGEWVSFPGTPYRASATIVREWKPVPSSTSVQLDVRFDLGGGRVIIESFAGIGASKEEARADAVENLVANSFHVLLRAFLVSEDNQVAVEDWEIDGKLRHVIIGNVGMRGESPQPDHIPVEWFPEIETKLRTLPLAAGTHWIRVYYAQMKHEQIELEVLLDNDDWEPLKTSATAIDWPKGKDFFSVRIFMIITDK